MTSLAAYEVAQGGSPDVRGLFGRTTGFLPRLAPVTNAVRPCRPNASAAARSLRSVTIAATSNGAAVLGS